jgi:phage host-nuclease inhibitor protein Gam
MDPIIEEGYTRLLETLGDLQAEKKESASELRGSVGALLARMATDTAPVVAEIGLEMLQRAKREASGELYDQGFYEKKMIVLGKTDPLPYRPDDPTLPVDAQICVLGEDGVFYEVMYTHTEIRIDSYLATLAPEEAFDVYGYDLVCMLYRAMFEYAQKEEELTAALARTLEYLAP